MAQVVGRLTGGQEAASSSLVTPIINKNADSSIVSAFIISHYPNFVVARDDRISDVYFLGFDDEEADIDSLLKETDLYDDSSDGRKRDRLFFKISSLH